METIKFIYHQENDIWVGWLEDYPDYRSQGTNLDELKENLKDIYKDLITGKIPHNITSSIPLFITPSR